MLKRALTIGILLAALTGSSMAQERISITSEWGNVDAVLADNEAAKALVALLPLVIGMRDHLRQEKTGYLPSPLPEIRRQTGFSKGMLGLWNSTHFVIYYSDGHVPQPGIID